MDADLPDSYETREDWTRIPTMLNRRLLEHPDYFDYTALQLADYPVDAGTTRYVPHCEQWASPTCYIEVADSLVVDLTEWR